MVWAANTKVAGSIPTGGIFAQMCECVISFWKPGGSGGSEKRRTLTPHAQNDAHIPAKMKLRINTSGRKMPPVVLEPSTFAFAFPDHYATYKMGRWVFAYSEENLG